MTFQINGNKGIYDGIIKDDSVRYGRNAADNNINYMIQPIVNDNYTTAPILDFMPTEEADEKNAAKINKFIKSNDEYLNSLPPLEYEYRYMPQNGKIDTKALIGAAYEEMRVKEMPVDEFESKYVVSDDMTAEPMDINKDGKIDLGEYSANILAADVLSKGTTDPMKAYGTINSKGLNAVLEYSKKSRAEAAAKLYSSLYNAHKLNEAYSEFTSDENNLVK